MAFKHTADQMIKSIKKRIRVPVSQSTYTTSDIMELIDEELERHVVPKIMAVRENYFMHEEDTTLVGGQQSYKIPYRAIGGKIKVAKYLNAQNEEQRMKQVPYENVYIYQDGDYNEPLFYIKRNSITIVPSTNNYNGGKIRWGYYLKPSSTVPVDECSKVTAINTTSNVVTVDSRPAGIATNAVVDIVRGKGGFECLSIDQSTTGTNTTFTFTETLPVDLAVGDYVCNAEESPFPQIPADIHSYLTIRVCMVMLKGLGFFKEAEDLKEDLLEAESVFDTMLTPRTEGNPKKIINWYSTLRR